MPPLAWSCCLNGRIGTSSGQPLVVRLWLFGNIHVKVPQLEPERLLTTALFFLGIVSLSSASGGDNTAHDLFAASGRWAVELEVVGTSWLD